MLCNVVSDGVPMRIMHLSRATLMICQFLLPVMELQKKKGHYVCVCGSDDSDVDTLRGYGIDVFPHNLRRDLNPFNVIKGMLYIKNILIEQKIDVIVCHTPIGAGIGRIAARLAKTPHIIYFAHGLACAPGQNFFLWFIQFCVEWLLGRITDAILVMNSYDENLCKKYHIVNPRKVFRVPGMGVDIDKFATEENQKVKQQICAELHIPKNAKIILCIAYLIAEKGVFVFQKAAGEICNQRSDIYFLLAGEGPEMDTLQANCSSHQVLNKNFKVLGWRNDIYRLMSTADLFVLPTYYFEGLPVSILEAMACGKPVIATKHRGCEDIVVDGETGFLIPIKKTKPLAEKIELLVDNKPLREKMGIAGRLHIEQSYEITNCTNQIVNTIDRAITQ